MEPNDHVMVDGFGRAVDEDLYWRNTGLSSASIAEIKEYHRTHPVQADGSRLKEEGGRVKKDEDPQVAGGSYSH